MKKQANKRITENERSSKENRQLISELQLQEDELRSLRQQVEQMIQQRSQRLQEINKRLEGVVEDARQYAENIVETVRDPLIVLDSSLLVVSANVSFYRTFKVTAEETEGKHIYELGNNQWDIPKLRELLETILPRQTVFNDFEVEHNFADLGHRVMLLNARQICRKEVGQGLILLAIEDITERKHAEEAKKQAEKDLQTLMEELKRSNADLEQFAYAASHDLQEPLRVVAGFVGLLEKRYKDKLDEKADGFIEYAVDGVKRMQSLIKDLLAYSQVGTKGKIFRPTICAVALEQAIYNLHTALDESGAEITYGPLPTVLADSSQLTRLFQNLMGNAIKFRGKERLKIHISAEQKGDEWVFSVRDNGIGIDPKFFNRIFVVFQRLHTKEEYEGTGIGLAVCKKIVERHGGHMWVESEQGKGTMFFFTLPIKK